jgi:hypothetical protein
MRELVDQWTQREDTMEPNQEERDEDSGAQDLAMQMGWCPQQNQWIFEAEYIAYKSPKYYLVFVC